MTTTYPRRGHCCRMFPLSVSYEELKMRAKQGEPEAIKVLDAVIPLGPFAENQLFVHGFQPSEGRLEKYTCRHFDGHQCTDYENRPDMCRAYPPPGGACEYAGCQCDAVEPREYNGQTYMWRKR